MEKTYYELMNEISSADLYECLLAYGLFTDKLPPIFKSVNFYNYCETQLPSFSYTRSQYIYYESMRNINVPRAFAIPNPIAYQKLCRCLADNWDKLKDHFKIQTLKPKYKVSRIHIRKQKNTKSLFSMNYSNWQIDGTPEPDLLIGKKYIVKADISTCFPSIYTHSIPWALLGKETAKKRIGKKYEKEWYNQIDHYTQNCKNGETHGLLIGPHSSNVLSEVILTVIDKNLYAKNWHYIRNIDDYTCYVNSTEDAQKFLTDLNAELRNFDLTLNFKKTEIQELPLASTEQWIRKINLMPNILQKNGKLDFITTRAYLDLSIELMKQNKSNSAILNYAIKVLSNKVLTNNAKDYYIKTIFHLSLLYPYLIPLLDKYIFDKFFIENYKIKEITQKLFKLGLDSQNYEAICFSIYFALKYNFNIDALTADTAVLSNSCLFKILSFLYFKVNKNKVEKTKLENHARDLAKNDDDFNRNWLFTYESLPQKDLKCDWKQMKKYKVSFIDMSFIKQHTN